MSRKHHELKCESKYYQLVESGEKDFELRLNDRNYQVGDMVTLLESFDGKLSGRELEPKEIKYILKDCPEYGLKEGYCIFCFGSPF